MSEHPTLEALVQKRDQQIRTIAEVARLAISVSDLDTLLQRTVDLIIERFGYYYSGILLIDPSGEQAVLTKASGGQDAVNALSGFEVSVGSKSIVGWVTANNRSWVAADVDQDPNYMELEALPETKSEIGLPLSIGDKVLGVLDVQSSELNAFNEEEVAILQTIADQIASTLEKISAIDAMTERLSELQSLNTISQSIATETELQRLYEILHHSILQVMGRVNFLVALYDASTNMVHIPYMDDGDGVFAIPPFPLGQGLTSVIIQTRQPLMIVEDAENKSRELGAIVTGEKPAMSWLGVPLLFGGEIIGVMVVQDLEEEHRFDNHDLRLLTTLSGQVASTIHNARLLTNTQETTERDRLLFEIINKIRQTNDINTVMQITAQELSKTLNARRAHIDIIIDPFSLETGGNGLKRVPEEVTK